VLAGLLDEARADAELDGGLAAVAMLCMAGVDFPREEERLAELVSGREWASRTTVVNDTFAVLRAGTEQGHGVAVVCGAGINCVGVAPDGRHVLFPALGGITGDWGGGYDVGMAGLSAAARSEDGRGPSTRLQRLVPAHFGEETPLAVAHAIHVGRIAQRRVLELAPIVLRAAAGDAVAASIRDRLVDELVALARATVTRLGLQAQQVEVVVGGGLMRGADSELLGRIESGLQRIGPQLVLRRTSAPPIVGAALLGLDAVGAGADAQARLRVELSAAVEKHERTAVA
jgi:N-acetylglucosamine kinase-like BadF-type ATPase